MSHYLALQSTYTDVECALFRGTYFVDAIRINKKESSSMMLIDIQELLSKHKVPFQSLDFLAVNAGPGPFTTLRVVIATVNGLSFASGTPLIAVDGLKAFLGEYHKKEMPTIAFLNAFGGDLYFGIQVDDHVETGFEQAATLLPKIAKRFENQSIQLIGNGIAHHKQLINSLLKNATIIDVDTPSIQAIGNAGFELWQNGDRGSQQLMPHYLKQAIGLKAS